MYFTKTNNMEQLRTQYKNLCLKLHPDKGGEHEQFCAMFDEYQKILKNLAWADIQAGGKTEFSYEGETALSKALREVMVLKGIDIELCGSWIWVSGETFPVKDKLREMGYFYSRSKKKWYFPAYGLSVKGKYRGRYSMKKIREKYGSQKIEGNAEELEKVA